jgi:hypothetical protein
VTEIHNIKEKELPFNRRVLVFVVNAVEPDWYIDCFYQSGPSDLRQMNGTYYGHNISHWAELPEKP